MLAESIEDILKILGFYFEEAECTQMIDAVLPLLSNDAVEVRRGASHCIGHICRYVIKCPISDVCYQLYDMAVATLKVSVWFGFCV